MAPLSDDPLKTDSARRQTVEMPSFRTRLKVGAASSDMFHVRARKTGRFLDDYDGSSAQAFGIRISFT
jgi:hypothetical protein